MTTCLIALGSNVGDRLAHLRAAVTQIGDLDDISIVAVSALYETSPIGGPSEQSPYFNAAILAESQSRPGNLLRSLHQIEGSRQRTRDVRWGPRTLDLDLLVFGDVVSASDDLQLPHPRLHQRRFVLAPICDVAPDMIHPTLHRPMRELLNALPVEVGDLTRIADEWADLS
ncbi:MAG: 2-amino-4-hydroxy-6-hydroxymethyldihydropteridine diphosphokinase [Hyphomicrobiaceae bacterium]